MGGKVEIDCPGSSGNEFKVSGRYTGGYADKRGRELW